MDHRKMCNAQFALLQMTDITDPRFGSSTFIAPKFPPASARNMRCEQAISTDRSAVVCSYLSPFTDNTYVRSPMA